MKLSAIGSYALSLCAFAAMLAGCAQSSSAVPPTLGSEASHGGFGIAVATEHVLYSFSGGNDGGNAATGLVVDSKGNLYGTTVQGGMNTCGTVFKLTPRPSPPWTESVLYDFGCFSDGKNPHGGVTFDRQGNLDGTTVSGGMPGCGSYGCGVLFQLTPTTENVLHSFAGGNDGFGPGAAVAIDSAGHVFGETPDGGAHSQGTIYEVSGSGTHAQKRTLHAFTGGNDGGTGSLGTLLLKSGTLYGVTETGGANQKGTAFKLSVASRRLTTLFAFKGQPDSGSPYGGLVMDAHGNLFGTTYDGGANNMGAVFELSLGTGGKYSEHVLYSFKGGNDGSASTGTLVFGASGELYGTTSAGGGSCSCGTIFRVNAKTGRESVVHRFGGANDGMYPYYGLAKGSNGTLYGATSFGGTSNQGAVFEFKP
jgi:uncharacterized repeat protein (TIGR03803 family)